MKFTRKAIAAAAVAALPTMAWASGNLFNGSISWSTSTDPIIATEQWANAATTLTWSISYNAASAFPWEYSYTWSAPTKGLSHLILEVSLSAVGGDFSLPTSGVDGPKTFGPGDMGNSNEGIPGNIYGIKFDGGGVTSKSISFASTHAPTWGDFFAKDGSNRRNGVSYPVYAYNSGYLQADPIVDLNQIAHGNLSTLQHDGIRANHIAVPDTLNLRPPDFIPVPEATAGWGLVGLVGAAAYSVRRKRAAAEKSA